MRNADLGSERRHIVASTLIILSAIFIEIAGPLANEPLAEGVRSGESGLVWLSCEMQGTNILYLRDGRADVNPIDIDVTYVWDSQHGLLFYYTSATHTLDSLPVSRIDVEKIVVQSQRKDKWGTMSSLLTLDLQSLQIESSDIDELKSGGQTVQTLSAACRKTTPQPVQGGRN